MLVYPCINLGDGPVPLDAFCATSDQSHLHCFTIPNSPDTQLHANPQEDQGRLAKASPLKEKVCNKPPLPAYREHFCLCSSKTVSAYN